MSARIDIVNYALSILGEKAIESLEDNLPQARVMKRFYYLARDAELEGAEWTFATKRFLPAASSTPPPWGWQYAFPIPSEIIRVIQVDRNWVTVSNFSASALERDPVPHEVEGREILCDQDVIYCKGIRRIEDEGIYSPLFAEAFGARLAVLGALPLTESAKVQQLALTIYAGLIKDAKSRDGMQNSTRRIRNKSFSRVR